MKFLPHPRLNTENPPTQLEILVHAFDQIDYHHKTPADYLNGLLSFIEIVCPSCGSNDLKTLPGGRTGKCRNCGKVKWLTADTILDGIKRPDAWLTALLLLQEKIVFNNNQLAVLIKISHSSVANIVLRASFVLNHDLKLSGKAVAYHSAEFDEIYDKRSVKTPIDLYPIAEQQAQEEKELREQSDRQRLNGDQGTTEAVDDGNLVSGNNSSISVGDSVLTGDKKSVFESLSKKPLHFDEICKRTGLSAGVVGSILIMLELEGLIQSLPGDSYVQFAVTEISSEHQIPVKQNNFKRVADVIDTFLSDYDGSNIDDLVEPETPVSKFITFIKTTFQGISRKNLQLYLARYWCYIDTERWTTESNSLVKAFVNFRQISKEELRAFVSPVIVQAIL